MSQDTTDLANLLLPSTGSPSHCFLMLILCSNTSYLLGLIHLISWFYFWHFPPKKSKINFFKKQFILNFSHTMFQNPSLLQCIRPALISHFPSPSIPLWQTLLSLPTFLFLSSQGGLFWGGIFCFVLHSNFPATPSIPTFFVSCYTSDHSEQFHIMSNHINAYKN